MRKRQPESPPKALVLDLARQGYSPAAIAQKTGVHRSTAASWLKPAAPVDTDDLACPECGGAMKKQELFFWQCECGAEFWPPEDQVPDDPDEWTVPEHVRAEGLVELFKLARRLHEKGAEATEIAAALNEGGLKSPRGKKPWTGDNVRKYLTRWGLVAAGDDYRKQRERIEKITEEMARKGYNCHEIADRLNIEGFKTVRKQPWTMHNVLKIVRGTLGLDIPLQMGHPGIPRQKVRNLFKLEDKSKHPWRLAEDAGARKWRAKKTAKEARGK